MLKSAFQFFVFHRRELAAPSFFVFGFVIDLLFAQSFDDLWTFLQHSVFLFGAWILLLTEFSDDDSTPRSLAKYRVPVLQFLLGSLLSAYFVLFFRSASLLHSLFFMFLVGALLLLNESARFQSLGRGVRTAMATLCLLCFSNIVVAVLLGRIGLTVFLLALLQALAIIAALVRIKSSQPRSFLLRYRKGFLFPALGVTVFFLFAYLAKWTPPIPLAVKQLGIYHKVERVEVEGERRYKLSYYKDWWRLWNSSGEYFVKEPDDVLYVFFRVFSPAQFEETLRLQWYRQENDEWSLQDSVPIKVAGGRLEGYRGFARKRNYGLGEWKLVMLSSDSRVMSELKFSVVDGDTKRAPLRIRYQ